MSTYLLALMRQLDHGHRVFPHFAHRIFHTLIIRQLEIEGY